MLAARIMVEDCMSLLLDVDDIERMFRQGVAKGMRVEGADALMQRRAVLMEGLASSLRLPDEAVLAGAHSDAAAGDKSSSDGVFLRLVTLPKGRRLLAQSLAGSSLPLSLPAAPQIAPSSASSGRSCATCGLCLGSSPQKMESWSPLRSLKSTVQSWQGRAVRPP